MFKRVIIFSLTAILLLPVGCIAAMMVWARNHHRYDDPDHGFYYGHVSVKFMAIRPPCYSLSFESETDTRWYWELPRHFSYSKLEVNWWNGAGEHNALVKLPESRYHLDQSSGSFTRETLSDWLTREDSKQISDEQLNTVYGYFTAAAKGTLPGPRHHGYSFDGPVMVTMEHARLGMGVVPYTYFWLGIWLLGCVVVGMRFLRRCPPR